MRNKFIKDFSIYGIGSVISRFAGVITAPIYTRFLSTSGYGLLDLMTTISAIIMIFALMQMPTGYGRSYYSAKEKGELRQLRGSVMIYFFGSFLLLILLFLVLRPFLDQWISIFDTFLLIPIVLKILPAMIIALTLVTLRFEMKSFLFSIISILHVFITALGGIIAVTYFDLGVTGILWSNTIVSYLLCVSLLILLHRYTTFKIELSYLKEIFYYSAPILPARIGTWLNQYIGRIFIAGALSLSILGIYSIALKVGLVMTLATYAFKQTWSPRANKLFSQEGSESKFVDMLNYYFLGFTFILILVVSFCPILVRFLAPEDFYPASSLIGLIAVGLFWEGAKNILSSGNNWERKTYYNSIGSIMGGLLNILILYFFISSGGVIVAAIAFMAGSLVQAILFLATSQYNHYIPYSYKKIILAMVILLGYAFLPYYLYSSVGTAAYIGILFVTGFTVLLFGFYYLFEKDEKTQVIKLIAFKK